MDYEKLFDEIAENRRKLDNCKKHKFDVSKVDWNDVSTAIGMKFICVNCGGKMQATEAAQYVRGFEAAGGDPNEIIEGWRE